MLLDSGVRALSKVLKACVGRQLCQLTPPPIKQHNLHMRWPNVGKILPSMLWAVVVLLSQRDDQLKIEFP